MSFHDEFESGYPIDPKFIKIIEEIGAAEVIAQSARAILDVLVYTSRSCPRAVEHYAKGIVEAFTIALDGVRETEREALKECAERGTCKYKRAAEAEGWEGADNASIENCTIHNESEVEEMLKHGTLIDRVELDLPEDFDDSNTSMKAIAIPMSSLGPGDGSDVESDVADIMSRLPKGVPEAVAKELRKSLAKMLPRIKPVANALKEAKTPEEKAQIIALMKAESTNN